MLYELEVSARAICLTHQCEHEQTLQILIIQDLTTGRTLYTKD